MALEGPGRSRKRKKLGRGLSDISHVFLSGAERRHTDEVPEARPELWVPDVEIMSITSGEGVRGKTFLAANLAFRLAAEGYRIALLDADPGRPGIRDITGAGPTGDGPNHLSSNSAFGAIPEVDLLATGSPPVDGDEKPPLIGAIEQLMPRVQRIIVDTSPEARVGAAVWKFAKLVLVVTEPSSEGMKASYVTVKRVHAASPLARIGLVVNLAGDRETAGRCHRKLSNVCRRFLKTNLRNYGYIVPSEAVEVCGGKAVPLAREYPAAKITECLDYIFRLIMMDQMAIARRRREVTARTCASREGK
jgi:MinD-like ATPase involved in chromosome partitioning or flagellar assembly